MAVEERLRRMTAAGVVIVDPRQTWVGEDVDTGRVRPGAILHPGTRLSGVRTFVGARAEVGREGPVVLVNAVLDEDARVDSGFVDGAVLLRGAVAGSNAHFRAGTLLEEEASTAHAVGLKHTILLSFVTLGSLINFCDCLMAGGTSRKNHSEVGSGFIHFNFTPWGVRGDKATPSLLGDVARGVLLRSPRIFVGGSAGMVGPLRVGYGAVVGAGGVLRKDVPAGRLVVSDTRAIDLALPVRVPRVAAVEKGQRNVEYVAHLIALREWYRAVRLARIDPARVERRAVIEAALETIELAIAERVDRLGAFLQEHGITPPTFQVKAAPPCPLAIVPGDADHVAWVQGLDASDADRLQSWLEAIVGDVRERATLA